MEHLQIDSLALDVLALKRRRSALGRCGLYAFRDLTMRVSLFSCEPHDCEHRNIVFLSESTGGLRD